MMNMVKNSGNPNAMIATMINNNPQIKNLIQQYGGDPKTAFYKLAEQKGVDPDSILQLLS